MIATFDAAAWLADETMPEGTARPHAAATAVSKKCYDNHPQNPLEPGCSFRACYRKAPSACPHGKNCGPAVIPHGYPEESIGPQNRQNREIPCNRLILPWGAGCG